MEVDLPPPGQPEEGEDGGLAQLRALGGGSVGPSGAAARGGCLVGVEGEELAALLAAAGLDAAKECPLFRGGGLV